MSDQNRITKITLCVPDPDLATAYERRAELLDILRQIGPLECRLILRHLADHVYSARLANGKRITDAMDVPTWLRELADALRVPERVKPAPAEQQRWRANKVNADDL